jgi:hypothetical protein
MHPELAMEYYNLLRRVHAEIRPRTYVEVGVRAGASLDLARECEVRIGIDPAPILEPALDLDDAVILATTSDEAFATGAVERALGGRPLDLAFVDGMHLFEFALRDFANLERLAHAASVILVHDCLPIDAVTSARERTTAVWTGDVWKLVPCLLENRPELHVVTSDVSPSGLAFVTRLDPGSTVLAARGDELQRRWASVDYGWLGEDPRARLRVADDAWEQTLRAHERMSRGRRRGRLGRGR